MNREEKEKSIHMTKEQEEKYEEKLYNEKSSKEVQNQNQTHNVVKEAMGPNTKR